MYHRFEHRLSHQGIDPQMFMQMQGKTREELVENVKPEAVESLKREAVLVAIADAEGIEVSDDDLLEALQGDDTSPKAEKEAKKALDKLRSSAATRWCARTSGSAAPRRPSSTPRSRSRSTRPRPARSSGRPRRAGGRAARKLWTPGSGEPADRDG